MLRLVAFYLRALKWVGFAILGVLLL